VGEMVKGRDEGAGGCDHCGSNGCARGLGRAAPAGASQSPQAGVPAIIVVSGLSAGAAGRATAPPHARRRERCSASRDASIGSQLCSACSLASFGWWTLRAHYVDLIGDEAKGQPAWLIPWFHFWLWLVSLQPTVFVYVLPSSSPTSPWPYSWALWYVLRERDRAHALQVHRPALNMVPPRLLDGASTETVRSSIAQALCPQVPPRRVLRPPRGDPSPHRHATSW
jgi:hypothetical protein